MKAGADSVNDIRFTLSDQTKARTNALAAAVKGARSKADAMAAAAGAHVTGLVSATEQSSTQPVYHAVYAEAALGTAKITTPIAPPNSLNTSVTVQVVWSVG